MTYEERTTQAMKMSLEELIFSYHYTMDTAENRLKTIHALRERCEEREETGWVSVHERLPDVGQVVLAYFPHRSAMKVDIEEMVELREAPVSFSSETIYTGIAWSESDYDDITKWMPLPEPPHQAEEKNDE